MTSRCFPGLARFLESVNEPERQEPTKIDAPILIPGLDLLNHNPSARVAWLWNAKTCSIQTDEVIPGEHQIWNNYGPKSNEERKILPYSPFGMSLI